MALYDYKADDGTKLTIERPMEDAPPNPIVQDGKTFYRVYGKLVINAAVRPSLRDGFFESRSLPRWDPRAPRHNPKTGKPQFTSRREAREYIAKVNDSPSADHETYGYAED